MYVLSMLVKAILMRMLRVYNQRRLIILLHARCCANCPIHGRFNSLSQQIAIYVRAKLYLLMSSGM